MNFEEFLKQDPTSEEQNANSTGTEFVSEEGSLELPEELDVQKAVVESLAADKAIQDEELRNMRQQIAIKEGQIKAQEAMKTSLNAKIEKLKAEVARLESELFAEKSREFDQQERNPNALALLDRDVEIPDRFPGESRDHVLEALLAARAQAEAEGRVRKAQILEGVLVANEPNGTLAARRAELEKLFAENGNIVNGIVIRELTRLGISHKNGEEYLMPSEILKRTY